MDIQNIEQSSSGLLFPDAETLLNLDFRFNGKDGGFYVGAKSRMPENYIVFAPISFAQVFGNIGKHYKDTNFLSVIAYAYAGAYGKQLIRIFLKGIHSGTAHNFAILLQTLQCKGIFPYKCLFRAEAIFLRKGDYDVYDLNFSYDISSDAIAFCNEIWKQMPGIDWYNNLAYHKPGDDVIVVWQNTIALKNGKPYISRSHPYEEATLKECLEIERKKQMDKLETTRENLQISKAREIAQKYLKGVKK